MTKLESIKSKKEEILKISKIHGAISIRVFGSVARGDENPSSDVDFLVTLEPGRSAFDLGGLLMDLEDLLHCRVDLVTEKGLNPLIKAIVLREAINI